MKWSRLLLAMALPIEANELNSERFRMVSPATVSIAATASSPIHQAQIAGGSGAPVGIAASVNSSVVAGPTSAELPTDGMFQDSLESG